MIIGTHNTMSYLPVRQWWLRPFRRFGRCQDRSIEEQWARGARYFDLRVRFDKAGALVFAHGLLEYDCKWTPGGVLAWLGHRSAESGEKVYVRVMLETVMRADSCTVDAFMEAMAWLRVPTGVSLRLSVKNRFRTLADEFDRPFVEVAEWINTPLKFLLGPRWYASRSQRVRLSGLGEDCESIVSMDFL